jgi:hypothetical protein
MLTHDITIYQGETLNYTISGVVATSGAELTASAKPYYGYAISGGYNIEIPCSGDGSNIVFSFQKDTTEGLPVFNWVYDVFGTNGDQLIPFVNGKLKILPKL